MRDWRRFQIEIRPEAFDVLAEAALDARRSVKEQAAWMLEQMLLERREPGVIGPIVSGEADG